jgi:hypothetical protein
MSTAAHLPRLASWLLRRLTSGPNREALIGDLDEQFARGRSSAWYWRQVVSAIVVGVTRDLRQHQLLAIRSVILTWVVVIAWVESTWTLYLWVSDRWVYAWVNHSVALFEFWIPFGGGLCIIWCVGSAVSGWVSARWSGDQRTTMVTASALAQIPWILWWTRPVWLHADMIARISARLWLPNYVWAAIVIIGMPACTFIGGLWGADDRPFPPPAR